MFTQWEQAKQTQRPTRAWRFPNKRHRRTKNDFIIKGVWRANRRREEGRRRDGVYELLSGQQVSASPSPLDENHPSRSLSVTNSHLLTTHGYPGQRRVSLLLHYLSEAPCSTPWHLTMEMLLAWIFMYYLDGSASGLAEWDLQEKLKMNQSITITIGVTTTIPNVAPALLSNTYR